MAQVEAREGRPQAVVVSQALEEHLVVRTVDSRPLIEEGIRVTTHSIG